MLFTKGNQFSVFPFKVFWIDRNPQPIQTGIGVSSRNFKKATDRNRIKRLMREAYRLQKNTLTDKLSSANRNFSVFILYTGKDLPEYDIISEKMKAVINRLIKLADEKDQ